MTPPVAVILNIRSGSADPREQIADLFRENGIDARIIAAPDGADIGMLASRAITEGFLTLVAGGGDGTISGVASKVIGTKIVLGVIPIGTLNHFAKDLRIPLTLADAIRNLKTGRVEEVDVAEVNGRTFLNNSGLGLYPRIVTQRQKYQRLVGSKWVALIWSALTAMKRFHFMKVRLNADGLTLLRTTPFVFVGNNAYELEGFGLGSRARLNAGHLSLCVAHRKGRWGLFRMAVRAMCGNLRAERDFDVLYTEDVVVETRRKKLSVSIDGEVIHLKAPLHYRIRPLALRVVVPSEQETRP